MAIVATPSGKKHMEEIKKQQSAKAAKVLEDVMAIASKLSSKTIQVGAKAGTSGKLFGSVTNIQVADAIKKEFDIDVDRRDVNLTEEAAEAIYNLTALAKFDERFVIPAAHREQAIEMLESTADVKGNTGFGFTERPARGI